MSDKTTPQSRRIRRWDVQIDGKQRAVLECAHTWPPIAEDALSQVERARLGDVDQIDCKPCFEIKERLDRLRRSA